MELSPEERQRIYEEEKARLEARNQLLQEEISNIPEEDLEAAQLAEESRQ